jgi:hypothetical protein
VISLENIAKCIVEIDFWSSIGLHFIFGNDPAPEILAVDVSTGAISEISS